MLSEKEQETVRKVQESSTVCWRGSHEKRRAPKSAPLPFLPLGGEVPTLKNDLASKIGPTF